jgi:hypothetical protein
VRVARDSDSGFHGESVPAMVFRTGRAARRDSHENAPSPDIQYLQALGLRSGVGVPIVVGGRLWGAANVGSSRPEPLPAGTEARVGTSRTWSPPRLRTAEVSMPPDWRALREKVSDVVAGLTGVSEDLQEISRGIHPAILSRGGLGPALKTLARRSAVPVELRLGTDRRLPEAAEVAAYYVVAEALTNVAKYAQASEARVGVDADCANLRLSIADDGVGGADSRKGSGLIGLVGRVEALGGSCGSPASSATARH